MISKTDKYEFRKPFNEAELKSVCRAITEDGISGSEIGYLLKVRNKRDASQTG